MNRIAKSSGLAALLLASGLAVSACVATVPEPYYAGPPAYYGYAPGYYARPAQSTFVFSYTDRDRRGPPRHRNHHRHW